MECQSLLLHTLLGAPLVSECAHPVNLHIFSERTQWQTNNHHTTKQWENRPSLLCRQQLTQQRQVKTRRPVKKSELKKRELYRATSSLFSNLPTSALKVQLLPLSKCGRAKTNRKVREMSIKRSVNTPTRSWEGVWLGEISADPCVGGPLVCRGL